MIPENEIDKIEAGLDELRKRMMHNPINDDTKDQNLRPLFNIAKLNEGAKEIASSNNIEAQNTTTIKIEESKKEKKEIVTCNICRDPKCKRNPGDRKNYCLHYKEDNKKEEVKADNK